MNPEQHQPAPSPDEHQLIAFHLGEPCKDRAVRDRLEHDPAFATLSEEIARTLRVFSADPVPQTDTEAAWQRLRGTLPRLQPMPANRVLHLRIFGGWWLRAALTAAFALTLITFGTAALHYQHKSHPAIDNAGIIYLRPPIDTASSSGEAAHLDRAERWLTTVNHTTAPLDPDTRAEGQHLLTENATFLQNARARGDLPGTAVLDHLDRVLTSSSHPAEAGLQLRLDMNTDGLLFQIRILRQNQAAPTGDPQ